jgi:hypothetical protein
MWSMIRSYVQRINRTASFKGETSSTGAEFFYFWVFAGPDRTQLEMRQMESQSGGRRLRSGDDREDPGEFDLVEEHLYRRRTLGSLYQ